MPHDLILFLLILLIPLTSRFIAALGIFWKASYQVTSKCPTSLFPLALHHLTDTIMAIDLIGNFQVVDTAI